jgi:hypothetical protein
MFPIRSPRGRQESRGLRFSPTKPMPISTVEMPMADDPPQSTLTRPDEALIRRFAIWQVRDRTIRAYLEKGFSLAICCRDCPRTIEWTPPELLRRFETRLELPLKDLVPRMCCTGEGGCGSHDIAVFPHLYDGAWTWPPA